MVADKDVGLNIPITRAMHRRLRLAVTFEETTIKHYVTALLDVALPTISDNTVTFPDVALVAELQRRLAGGSPQIRALLIVDDSDDEVRSVLNPSPKVDATTDEEGT